MISDFGGGGFITSAFVGRDWICFPDHRCAGRGEGKKVLGFFSSIVFSCVLIGSLVGPHLVFFFYGCCFDCVTLCGLQAATVIRQSMAEGGIKLF